MSQESLDAALARLRQELQGSARLDAESRRQVEELRADLDRTRPPAASAAHASRLEALAVQFETEHPELASSLRGIADALGRIGL